MEPRNKNLPHPRQVLQYQLASEGGYIYYSYSVTNVNSGVDRLTIFSDYRGPKPRGRKKPLHDHVFTKTYRTDYVGLEEFGGTRVLNRNTGWLRSSTHFFAPNLSFNNIYNTALDRAYSSLRGQVDLSVDLFQAKQTRDMIGGYRDKIMVPHHSNSLKGDAFHSQHLKAVAKMNGKIGRLADFISRIRPKDWTNKWLEYQYGWRPLVNSIYGTLDQLMDMHRFSYVRVVGTASENETTNMRYPGTAFGEANEDVFMFHQKRVKIVGLYAMKDSRIQSLANYTSLNPVSIAWELLPYSFVIDWVYNVGGYLRNLESEALFQDQLIESYFVQGYKTEHRGVLSTASQYTQPGNYHTIQGRANQLMSHKNRGAAAMGPRPPTVKLKLGWERAASAVALLNQHLGRR